MSQFPNKTRNGFALVPFVIALAVALGLAGYIISGKYKKVSAPSFDTSPADISDWQTYRNEQYGFEFKYPNDWNKQGGRSEGFGITYKEAVVCGGGVGCVFPGEFSMGVYDKKDLLFGEESVPVIFDQFVMRYTKDFRHSAFSYQSSSLQGRSVARVATVQKAIGPDAVGVPDEAVLIEYSPDKVIRMEMRLAPSYYLRPTYEEQKEHILSVFDQILSTFKFTQPSPDISDWKTYRSEQYGFEFRYPGEYGYFEIITPLKRLASVYLDGNHVRYRDNVMAKFATLSSDASEEDVFPSQITVNVFNFDDYRFTNQSVGIEQGYDKTDGTWWQDNGIAGRQVATPRAFTGDGWTAYQFGEGDAGTNREEWVIPNRQRGLMIAIAFDTSELAVPTQKTFSIGSILSTFRFTK